MCSKNVHIAEGHASMQAMQLQFKLYSNRVQASQQSWRTDEPKAWPGSRKAHSDPWHLPFMHELHEHAYRAAAPR